MDKKCYVIGVYPPPYGGATVKCKLFCEMLRKGGENVKQIDIYEMSRDKKRIPFVLNKCIKAFRSKSEIVYCLDSKRLWMIMSLQSIFKQSFNRTTVLVIGGVFHETVLEYKRLGRNLKLVKGIWVETEGMKQKLVDMGYDNIEVFPNPKSEIGCCEPRVSKEKDPLRLLFFSQISKEKGVKDIIKLVHVLDSNKDIKYSLDFYGQIVEEFKKEFEEFVSKSPNVRYCGVFDSTKSSVYKKLNEYDILLFPTHWKGEGVPGILVEAKMAGLAVIASPMNFNAEIIREDKDEGFLLKKDYPNEMLEIIQKCMRDKKLLEHIKLESYRSRKRYAISEYEKMIKCL